MTELAIDYRPISALLPYARNARKHSEAQVNQIASSIREFGFNSPILVDEKDMVVAGHGRLKAAHKLGMELVPCVRLKHLNENQVKAYNLLDNQIALNAEWDRDLLKLELEQLADVDILLAEFGLDLDDFSSLDVDYSAMDDEPDQDLDAMRNEVKKAVQLEFNLEDYEEAQALIKFWREKGAYVGGMLIDALKEAKGDL